MNVTNIEATRKLIEAAKKVDMESWQSANYADGKDITSDFETFHTCGNSACIAGYAGLTEEFKNGTCSSNIDVDGTPELTTEEGVYLSGTRALAKFFDIPVEVASDIVLNDSGIVEDMIGEDWYMWNWQDAVTVLNNLLNGSIATQFNIPIEEFHYES